MSDLEDLVLLSMMNNLQFFMERMRRRRRQPRRRHRFWVHPLVVERPLKGQFTLLYEDIRSHPVKFFNYTRMSTSTFDYLLQTLGAHLRRQNTWYRNAVIPEERLLLTLRFLATGQSFASLHFAYRLGKSTISYIVKETCLVIWRELHATFMPVPNRQRWEEVANKFWGKCRFPNCIGAVDGKHIRLVQPPHSGSQYFNYKKFFSIVLMAVADANYKFLYIDVGAYGTASDSQIFRNTNLCYRMENGTLDLPPPSPWPGTTNPAFPYTFVGDEAFALSRHVMRPYSATHLNDRTRYFNYRLSMARRMVECSFGILANKWRVLHTAIQLKVENAVSVVKAACILHNVVIEKEVISVDEVNALQVPPLSGITWSGGQHTNEAIRNRDCMSHFFQRPAGRL
ncbi:uncharacterized protein [Hyperolius riggenbachi]|uniref:uncharacterized protein n=1 Tax=Hyperolius riggenbachi TaxID=752182 RepID=UPI0035A37EEF